MYHTRKKIIDKTELYLKSEFYHHNDNNIMYASTYQRRRHFGILVAGGPEGGIFKSVTY